MRRAWRVPAAALLTALLALAGCGRHKNLLVPDVPPETRLFVQGPVDTVNHIVHLYWFGSDPDGQVVGFQFRMLNPAQPADSAWRFTLRSDSLFVVYTPAGFTAPTFEVRAIDQAGLVDPTPAIENFQFSNQPPVVALTGRLFSNDSTFASVTATWTVSDPDGDASRATFRVWLKGDEANTYVTAAHTFTMPSAAFFRLARWDALHTLYVQAIDDGGMAGAPDSMRWFVRSAGSGAHGRLLLVDDLPTTNAINFPTDTLYRNTALRNLPAGSFDVLTLQFDQPFLSDSDVVQTFRQFDAVVWYRGSVADTQSLSRTVGQVGAAFHGVLQQYENALGLYLDGSGRFMLESMYAIGGYNLPGVLSGDFARRHLDTNELLLNFNTLLQDSTAGWGNTSPGSYYSSAYHDSLRIGALLAAIPGDAPGLEVFGVGDTSEVALWAPPGQLSPTSPNRLPIAVSVPQPSGGRAIVTTLPIWPARLYSSQPRLLAKVFQQLGLLGPSPF
ncbi:MAG TPA: hypothetical protein VFK69_11955 [Candidatus Eisenbacteria bacterium]|nr:hypothetical protein [Candidatus Eisenbacteria bacterium]